MGVVMAVINSWPSAERILAQAQQIAHVNREALFVYCPVASDFEEMNRYIGFDNYDSVRESLLAECQARLDELPGSEHWDMEVAWQPTPYKAVIDKAQQLSASMIVMAVSEHSVIGDLLHKPDDWHLLRESVCPVLILEPEYPEYKAVVVAVDVLEDGDDYQALNARVLDEGKWMAEILKRPLHVLSVVPDPAYIYSDIAATDSLIMTDFRSQAESLAKQRQQQLLSRLGIQAQQSLVVSGRLEKILQQALNDAGLLVIGTIANKGWKGFFLGNTSERLLQHLKGDMLVVN